MVLILLILGAGLCVEGSLVWLERPKSGSVVAVGKEVGAEIGLSVNSTCTEKRVCLRVSRARGDDITVSEEESVNCFTVSVEEASLTRDAPLMSATRLSFPAEGWYYVEVKLYDGKDPISSFAVGLFAAVEGLDNALKRLGLAWDLGGGIGWGVAGLQIALALADIGVQPVPLRAVHGFEMTLQQRQNMRPTLRPMSGGRVDFPVVHALGRWGANGSLGSMDAGEDEIWGTRNVGLLFAETNDWSERDLEALGRFDAILAGSSWCGHAVEGAAARYDRRLPPVDVFRQGIDPSLFFPPTAVNLQTTEAPPRFKIFSGGKLEWRKGHDIVIEAFKRFKRIQPEARPQLVVAWVNPWQRSLATIHAAQYTHSAPNITVQQERRSTTDIAHDALAIEEWLAANGIPATDVLSLPTLPHQALPGVLRQVDVALFPNRVEGGTNLVAMEAIASAVPTVLSANSGHLDLIDTLGDDIWCLHKQAPANYYLPPQYTAPDAARAAIGGAFDSDPDEAAAALAHIFRNRPRARASARAAASRMHQSWTWKHSLTHLVRAAFEVSEIESLLLPH